MPIVYGAVNLDLTVTGEPETSMEARFGFSANVSVRDPDTGIDRPAHEGEVHVDLARYSYGWPPWGVIISEADTPEGGMTNMGTDTVIETTDYLLRARHNVTGSEHSRRVTCQPDGTWVEIPV